MNRIRKKVELALLDPELQSISDGIDDVKKSKLMDGQNKDVEDHLSVPWASDSFLAWLCHVLGKQVREKLADCEKTRKFHLEAVISLLNVKRERG